MLHCEYDNKIFYLNNCGYFFNGKAGLLHRYKWGREVGDIPKGFVVHHIDEIKINNNIKNLVIMTKHDHDQYHKTHRSPESRMKTSIAIRGENHPMYGKKHTAEARRKISESKKGKELTLQHKKNLSVAHGTKVMCVNSGRIYVSIAEAERELGLNHVSRNMKQGKAVKGYRFEYV